MDSSISPKDEIWFLRVCHHISNAVYFFKCKTEIRQSVWFNPNFVLNSDLPEYMRSNSVFVTLLLFTSRSRVLLEKLTGSQLVNKFPAVYETRKFIITFTSARHLSLS